MIRIDLTQPDDLAVWRENPIGAFYELAKRSPGETAVLALPTDSVLIVQDAEKARRILRENAANYHKNFGGFMQFFGTSRITANSPLWEKLHRLSQPYINSSRPDAVVDAVNRNFGRAVEMLMAARDARSGVVVDRLLSRAAAGVVSEVALGFDSLEVDDALIDDFRALLDLGSTITWNFGGYRTEPDQSQRDAATAARGRLAKVFEHAMANAKTRGEATSLLTALFNAKDEGVDPVSEICSLLFAGFDTSASALGWGLFLLGATPDLQRHLRSRIIERCGTGPIDIEHLSSIPELAAFQSEVLRIFPPIPVLGRFAAQADRVGELDVARGQRIIVSIIGLHHDRRVFDAPGQVRLTRYTDGQLSPDLASHLLPFGAGRRMCGGLRLANVELTAAFALLIRALEFNLPDQRPLEFAWTASLRRKDGHYLLVRPAKAAAAQTAPTVP